MAAFIANNDSQTFLQQNLPGGVISSILGNSNAVSALLAADSFALQAFANGGSTALQDYLDTDPSRLQHLHRRQPQRAHAVHQRHRGRAVAVHGERPGRLPAVRERLPGSSSPVALLNYLNTSTTRSARLPVEHDLSGSIHRGRPELRQHLLDGRRNAPSRTGAAAVPAPTIQEGDPQVLDQFLTTSFAGDDNNANSLARTTCRMPTAAWRRSISPVERSPPGFGDLPGDAHGAADPKRDMAAKILPTRTARAFCNSSSTPRS